MSSNPRLQDIYLYVDLVFDSGFMNEYFNLSIFESRNVYLLKKHEWVVVLYFV